MKTFKSGLALLAGLLLLAGCKKEDAIPNNSKIINWKYLSGGDEYEPGQQIIKSLDGGFIVVSNPGLNVAKTFIYKFTSTGQLAWQRKYDGDGDRAAKDLIALRDGGYLVVGGSSSPINEFNSNTDLWVFKINAEGDVLWEKKYGGLKTEHAVAIVEGNDGGFLVLGNIENTDRDLDPWLLKIDENGNQLWEKSFRNTDYDYATAITKCRDGYFFSTEKEKDITDAARLIKVDNQGNLVYEKIFDGEGQDSFHSLIATDDNGVILAGSISGKGEGASIYGTNNPWLIKLNANGELEWQKIISGIGGFNTIVRTPGGYVVGGAIRSKDTQFNGWIQEIDESGRKQWEIVLGGSKDDAVNSLVVEGSKKITFLGSTSSIDGDVGQAIEGSYDLWIMQVQPK